MLIADIGGFMSAAVNAGPAALPGLDFAEGKIQELIDNVDKEIGNLEKQPEKFRSDAHIPWGMFGNGERAPNLSVHYEGAHNATYQSLNQTKKNLEMFLEAVINARNIIRDADERNADDMLARQYAVQAITYGGQPFQGDDD